MHACVIVGFVISLMSSISNANVDVSKFPADPNPPYTGRHEYPWDLYTDTQCPIEMRSIGDFYFCNSYRGDVANEQFLITLPREKVGGKTYPILRGYNNFDVMCKRLGFRYGWPSDDGPESDFNGEAYDGQVVKNVSQVAILTGLFCGNKVIGKGPGGG